MASGNYGRPKRRSSHWFSDRTTIVLLVCVCILFPILFCAVPARATDTSDSEDTVGQLVVGIDLGTTNSCVAVHRNGTTEIIPNDQGDRTTPSYFAVSEEGQRLVGIAAKNQASINPKNTVYDIKRVIGRPFQDEDIQADLRHFAFDLIPKNSKPVVKITSHEHSEYFSPEQVSAQILSHLKANAETYLGQPVTHAVITVPAYFNDAQRAATKDAGRLAGLTVLRIVNEPTAAAIAYGIGKDEGKDKGAKTVVVYDLGGGTFDASLLDIEDGVFEVLATGGDTHLGGEDFDNRVIEHLIARWNARYPEDVLAGNAKALSKLRTEVERAKRTLSSGQNTALIEIEAFHNNKDLSETLTRAKFEELNEELFQRTLKTVEAVLKDGKVRSTEVDEVILVGGSTRIPRIRELLSSYFGERKVRGESEVNPDEVVAAGAAIQGAILSGGDVVQPGLLININPLSLGIDADGLMAVLIPRNSIIPTKKSKIFTTTRDGQESISIRVLEGERLVASANTVLGSFKLAGIEPAPRGTAQIEVTFEMDADGILSVKAVDQHTKQSHSMEITNQENRLSVEEIERMILEAEEYAEKDAEIKRIVEAKSKLLSEAAVMQAQLQPGRQLGDKLSKDERTELSDKIGAVETWLNNPDSIPSLNDIETKARELSSLFSSSIPDHDEL